MKNMVNYEFTFKTISEYYKARFTGFIPEYKCVRMTIKNEGNTFDFPIHSEEELHETLKCHTDNVINIYPSTTFYEWDI